MILFYVSLKRGSYDVTLFHSINENLTNYLSLIFDKQTTLLKPCAVVINEEKEHTL